LEALEETIILKDREIERLASDKTFIKGQLEELLQELELIEMK
jgi:hypothetical protein